MTEKNKMLIMMMGKKPEPSDDEPKEEDGEGSEHSEGLKAAMEDFLKAVEDKDPSAMAECFKYAMDLYESGEHEEGKDDYEG